MSLDHALAQPLHTTEVRRSVVADRVSRRRRTILVTTVLGVAAAALFLLTMMVGSFSLSATDVLASLLHLRSDASVDFVVRELRFPTAATGIGVGIALGVAGLIFQRLLSNPLASPDLVGVSSGASLFAIASIILFDMASAGVSLAALVGALVSCGLVYVLTWRDGISGFRFILIGIGISEFMLSIVGYLIARAEISDAREAMTWLVGSLGQAGTGELMALLAAVAILVPIAMLLDRGLGILELGDDVASVLGLRIERSRLALIGVAIVLVGFATAAAGPIMFIALIAGPVAARALGSAAGGILAAGFVGAIFLLVSDLIAVHLLPISLPTGVVTGAIGAPYLVWLLATSGREGRAE